MNISIYNSIILFFRKGTTFLNKVADVTSWKINKLLRISYSNYKGSGGVMQFFNVFLYRAVHLID